MPKRICLFLILGCAALFNYSGTGASGDAGRAAPAPMGYDASIAGMLARVNENAVYTYTGQLSGEWPASAGGDATLITTRHTGSGEPISITTRFVYEHLRNLGMTVDYQPWSRGGYAGRNVAGVLTGTVKPAEIILLTAHVDSICDRAGCGPEPFAPAPGADDNASGAAGVMAAADILSRHRFERTLRFVFFTGEEQGLLGSSAYAAQARRRGDQIVAVFNMDMIGWDGDGDDKLRLHTRRKTSPGHLDDLAIAGVFTNVVRLYGLETDLDPAIEPDGLLDSDHSSFWDEGYPAILAIEDDVTDDFNPNYHSPTDTLQKLDRAYFASFIRAAVGTIAHLANPRVHATFIPMDMLPGPSSAIRRDTAGGVPSP
jgi:leucyl aminopeptidase